MGAAILYCCQWLSGRQFIEQWGPQCTQTPQYQTHLLVNKENFDTYLTIMNHRQTLLSIWWVPVGYQHDQTKNEVLGLSLLGTSIVHRPTIKLGISKYPIEKGHPIYNCKKISVISSETGVPGSAWINIYQTFLTSCIRCTDYLCDSCSLTDMNPHFIPSPHLMISKCEQIVTSSIHKLSASNCDVRMTDCSRVWSMDAFLSQCSVKYTFVVQVSL